MRGKILKGIILAILIILGAILTWKVVKYEEKYFLPVQLDTVNVVYNTTDLKFLDTIVQTGLSCLKIENIFVIIKPLTGKEILLENETIEVRAHTQNQGLQYIIWVKNLGREEALATISHELVHIQQFYFGRLITNIPKIAIWEGDTLVLGEVRYYDSPWEKEAFYYQREIEKEIRKVVYGRI